MVGTPLLIGTDVGCEGNPLLPVHRKKNKRVESELPR